MSYHLLLLENSELILKRELNMAPNSCSLYMTNCGTYQIHSTIMDYIISINLVLLYCVVNYASFLA